MCERARLRLCVCTLGRWRKSGVCWRTRLRWVECVDVLLLFEVLSSQCVVTPLGSVCSNCVCVVECTYCVCVCVCVSTPTVCECGCVPTLCDWMCLLCECVIMCLLCVLMCLPTLCVYCVCVYLLCVCVCVCIFSLSPGSATVAQSRQIEWWHYEKHCNHLGNGRVSQTDVRGFEMIFPHSTPLPVPEILYDLIPAFDHLGEVKIFTSIYLPTYRASGQSWKDISARQQLTISCAAHYHTVYDILCSLPWESAYSGVGGGGGGGGWVLCSGTIFSVD